jgi:regulator of sirC expression with transglutaminase-like and TPR domain
MSVVDVERDRKAFDVGDDGFSLWQAARLLPRVEGREPDDVEPEINRWSEQVRDRVRHAGPVVALHDVLFGTAGFQGDQAEYDHPRNSFVDDVVRRRRGLPIALSLVLIEVAERANLKAWGLALPGHFMAAVAVDGARPVDDDADRFVIVDPFRGGKLLPLDEVARRVELPPSEMGELLQPATPAMILVRMLMNLRGSYLRRQQHEPLCRVLSRMLLLRRRDPQLLLERAEVRRLLLDDDGAVADADAAIAVARDDEDVVRAGEHIKESVERGAVMN